MEIKKVGVALLGLGVVGGGTYKILTEKREAICKSDGVDIEIKRVLDKVLVYHLAFAYQGTARRIRPYALRANSSHAFVNIDCFDV